MKRFTEADVPASEVLTIKDHIGDPQVARGQLYTHRGSPWCGIDSKGEVSSAIRWTPALPIRSRGKR
jgi:crotonobetainyl-CoA:carnitine CoA-transferase CaiB-like acyl-CoA transferase